MVLFSHAEFLMERPRSAERAPALLTVIPEHLFLFEAFEHVPIITFFPKRMLRTATAARIKRLFLVGFELFLCGKQYPRRYQYHFLVFA